MVFVSQVVFLFVRKRHKMVFENEHLGGCGLE
jgi:hypothetical protein